MATTTRMAGMIYKGIALFNVESSPPGGRDVIHSSCSASSACSVGCVNWEKSAMEDTVSPMTSTKLLEEGVDFAFCVVVPDSVDHPLKPVSSPYTSCLDDTGREKNSDRKDNHYDKMVREKEAVIHEVSLFPDMKMKGEKNSSTICKTQNHHPRNGESAGGMTLLDSTGPDDRETKKNPANHHHNLPPHPPHHSHPSHPHPSAVHLLLSTVVEEEQEPDSLQEFIRYEVEFGCTKDVEGGGEKVSSSPVTKTTFLRNMNDAKSEPLDDRVEDITHSESCCCSSSSNRNNNKCVVEGGLQVRRIEKGEELQQKTSPLQLQQQQQQVMLNLHDSSTLSTSSNKTAVESVNSPSSTLLQVREEEDTHLPPTTSNTSTTSNTANTLSTYTHSSFSFLPTSSSVLQEQDSRDSETTTLEQFPSTLSSLERESQIQQENKGVKKNEEEELRVTDHHRHQEKREKEVEERNPNEKRENPSSSPSLSNDNHGRKSTLPTQQPSCPEMVGVKINKEEQQHQPIRQVEREVKSENVSDTTLIQLEELEEENKKPPAVVTTPAVKKAIMTKTPELSFDVSSSPSSTTIITTLTESKTSGGDDLSGKIMIPSVEEENTTNHLRNHFGDQGERRNVGDDHVGNLTDHFLPSETKGFLMRSPLPDGEVVTSLNFETIEVAVDDGIVCDSDHMITSSPSSNSQQVSSCSPSSSSSSSSSSTRDDSQGSLNKSVTSASPGGKETSTSPSTSSSSAAYNIPPSTNSSDTSGEESSKTAEKHNNAVHVFSKNVGKNPKNTYSNGNSKLTNYGLLKKGGGVSSSIKKELREKHNEAEVKIAKEIIELKQREEELKRMRREIQEKAGQQEVTNVTSIQKESLSTFDSQKKPLSSSTTYINSSNSNSSVISSSCLSTSSSATGKETVVDVVGDKDKGSVICSDVSSVEMEEMVVLGGRSSSPSSHSELSTTESISGRVSANSLESSASSAEAKQQQQLQLQQLQLQEKREGRQAHRTTKENRGAVPNGIRSIRSMKPYEEAISEATSRMTKSMSTPFLNESPIEREIRLVREREEELKREIENRKQLLIEQNQGKETYDKQQITSTAKQQSQQQSHQQKPLAIQGKQHPTHSVSHELSISAGCISSSFPQACSPSLDDVNQLKGNGRREENQQHPTTIPSSSTITVPPTASSSISSSPSSISSTSSNLLNHIKGAGPITSSSKGGGSSQVTGSIQRVLATTRIQQEIEEQTARELALKAVGSIRTTSQERTDTKVVPTTLTSSSQTQPPTTSSPSSTGLDNE